MLVSPFKIINSTKKIVKPVLKTGKFKLLDKTNKELVEDYKLQILPYAPEKAKTFTDVSIGKTNDPNYKKHILTFYSSDGKVLRKTFLSSDSNPIIRDYEENSAALTEGTKSTVRKITTKYFDKNTFTYKLKSVDEQKIYKTPYKTKLQINKNEIKDDFISASITEYPWLTKEKMDKNLKKVLGFNMILKNGIPVIRDVKVQNLKVPFNDKYLPFRMIFDDSLKRMTLSKFLLKEKGLEPLNTVIKFSKNLGKDIAAYFSELENCLWFSTAAKNNSVKLAAHEVQHAYQFSQIGRIGKGYTPYCKKSKELLGEITNPEEKNKALSFFIASENYPLIDSSNTVTSSASYLNNFLEKNANDEAERVYKEYKGMGAALGKQLCFGDF